MTLGGLRVYYKSSSSSSSSVVNKTRNSRNDLGYRTQHIQLQMYSLTKLHYYCIVATIDFPESRSFFYFTFSILNALCMQIFSATKKKEIQNEFLLWLPRLEIKVDDDVNDCKDHLLT